MKASPKPWCGECRVGAAQEKFVTRVIFIDIDDVLLTTRSLILPANRSLLKENSHTPDFSRVVFDPVGIQMLNRMAELSEGRFVLSTHWRYTVGVGSTLDALRRNGLTMSLFHASPYCPLIGARADGLTGKVRDISAWLEQHPEVSTWLILDNDHSLAVELATAAQGLAITVDPHIGISVRDYRLALDHLGVTHDPDLKLFGAFNPALAAAD